MNLSTSHRKGIGGDKTSHWGGGMVAHIQGQERLGQFEAGLDQREGGTPAADVWVNIMQT